MVPPRGVSVQPESGMRNRGRGLGLGRRRHHRRPPARRSLFLFSDRSDNAGDGSDARTMATVTKEEGDPGCSSADLWLGWKSEHIEFHTRTSGHGQRVWAWKDDT